MRKCVSNGEEVMQRTDHKEKPAELVQSGCLAPVRRGRRVKFSNGMQSESLSLISTDNTLMCMQAEQGTLT